MLEKELLCDLNNTAANRTTLHQAQAMLKLNPKMEDFWGQKSHLKWLKEGQGNTKLFHDSVKHTQQRLYIHKIVDPSGNLLEDAADIKEAAISYFRNQLQVDQQHDDSLVVVVPSLISEGSNIDLISPPSIDDVKDSIFSKSGENAARPDGFSGKFYSHCWDIIGVDFNTTILEFFAGFPMPSSWTSTLIAMIPKIDNPSSFKDLRPIRLCNFCNKVISKLLSTRLSKILPHIISVNQSAFTKGRVIQDNLLLAQELMNHRGKKVNGSNIIIKLYMAKAFDRVSWFYLIKMRRKFGFRETFVDLMWRVISNNWFFVLINGGSVGFFPSSRGLRQGDPLSWGLFIIAAEVLNHPYIAFSTSSGCPLISHLGFADDIMIFCNRNRNSLDKHKSFLAQYESCLGQLINSSKRCFITAPSLPSS